MALAELPVRLVQLVETLGRHGINKIFIRAPHKNLVVLVRAKKQLRDDGVGVAGG